MGNTPLVSPPHPPTLLIPQGGVLGLGVARGSQTIPVIRQLKGRGSNSHLEVVLEGKIQEGGQRGVWFIGALPCEGEWNSVTREPFNFEGDELGI